MLAILASSIEYDPVTNAIWKKGEKYALLLDHHSFISLKHVYFFRVPYMWLARTFAEIEQHSARTDITRLLTNMLRSVIELSPNDLLPCVYLTINKVLILP